MSGAMRRIGEYLGLLEDTGRYDDDYADDPRYDDTYEGRYADTQHPTETHPVAAERPTRRELREARQAATVAHLDDRRRGGAPTMTAAPRVAELSRITTLHPRTYNEARTVGENYRDGTPVIMNLSEMDDNDAKRLVDFAAGLIFATRGSIERVTSKVFLLSPPNVSVAAEDKARIADGGFFNQS
ncbi:cell division protein SepF [Nocardioides halotolerans]|uniref:cell division protein SepF n=1 Tax=Nocardioides halotolerans TaxID=433660 RepID=UPI000490308E|nr:cell division protein SepF [Nocardioides halotolerans]